MPKLGRLPKSFGSIAPTVYVYIGFLWGNSDDHPGRPILHSLPYWSLPDGKRQAAVNYEVVCRGFAKALKEITDEVSSVQAHQGTEMNSFTRALACDIYAQFLVFYCKCLKWFSSKPYIKALKSLNRDIYSDLRESVEVRRIAALITRHQVIQNGEIVIDMEAVTHKYLLELKQQQGLILIGMKLLQESVNMSAEDRRTRDFQNRWAELTQQGGSPYSHPNPVEYKEGGRQVPKDLPVLDYKSGRNRGISVEGGGIRNRSSDNRISMPFEN
jgi:hypothetical protein